MTTTTTDRNAKRRQANAERRQAEDFYDGWAESHLQPLAREEKVVIAHLRGWAHYGPLCRLCKVEAAAAAVLTTVQP